MKNSGERTYEAAWRVFCDRYSSSDGEFILTELLKNRMQFDGHDYSDYLPDDEGFTPDYDGALYILNNVETI